MEKKQFCKNNKGFTLVEVLVAVGILGIALVAITGFMVVGARTFASTSSEVNLQYESQLAFNQLQDMIVDTQRGIKQAAVTGGTEAVVPAEVIPADTVDEKKLYIYNDNVAYVIIWNRAESRLYYEEYGVTTDAMGEPILGAAVETDARMTDYITDFDIDISKLEAKSIVGVHMTFVKNTKSYDANYNITVRNKILVNKEMKETYAEPIETVPATTITTIPPILVEPGSTFQFPAPTVTSSLVTETPSQEVRWFIDSTEPGSGGNSITVNGGYLTVSETEIKDFRVKVQTPDGSADAFVDVKVRIVEEFKVTYTPLSKDKDGVDIPASALIKGSGFQLEATVKMNHEEELTMGASGYSLAEAKTLEWSIEEGEAYLTGAPLSDDYFKKWNGTMKPLVVEGAPLRVRATAKYSKVYAAPTGKFREWTGTTHAVKPDFYVDPPTDPQKDSDFERGMEYAFNVMERMGSDFGDLNGHIFLFETEIRKKIFDEDGNFTGYEEVNSDLFDHRTDGGNNVKIEFANDLPPYDEYEVDIYVYAFLNPSAPGDVVYGWLEDYSGYRKENAVGEGWLNTIELEKSELYFDNEDTLTKIYTPRKFSQGLNDTDRSMFTIGGITNAQKNEFNINRDNFTWAFYTNPEGGKREKDFTYYAAGQNGMPMYSCDQSGANLIIDFSRNSWSNNVPDVLYLVPTLHVNGKSYLMYHTYVKCINHNIEVEVGGVKQKLFFPYPTSGQDGLVDFPGVSMKSGYTAKGTWYKSYNFDDTLKYDLTKYLDSQTGLYKYTLVLWDSTRGTEYGTYKITEGELNWVCQ